MIDAPAQEMIVLDGHHVGHIWHDGERYEGITPDGRTRCTSASRTGVMACLVEAMMDREGDE